MMAMNKKMLEQEPSEIEALLPWHAAGTLGARDSRRVEEALARDPLLAKQVAVIREEYAETIALNESLGAPSARAMQRLFAAIDAEPARKAPFSFNLAARTGGFFASLSPRTLAFSAATAALLLLLQAGVIGAFLATRPAGSFQTAPLSAPQETPRALVRFVPDARLSDITAFLEVNQATIIGSAGGGMFRLQFGDRPMSPQATAALLTRLQTEKIVNLAVAAR
jgi:anti-sigma-K factor RskA